METKTDVDTEMETEIGMHVVGRGWRICGFTLCTQLSRGLECGKGQRWYDDAAGWSALGFAL